MRARSRFGSRSLAPTTRSRITSAASLPKAQSAPPTSARFVGVDTYEAAGGVVLRDLFQHDDGGWLQDPALLDRLVAEKLQAEAETLREEGWKWIAIATDFPYGHAAGLRRISGEAVEFTEEESAGLVALQAEQ